jgi:hypothetical protein
MAIAVGCKKCPVFSMCPLKSVIGDFKKKEEPKSKSSKAGKPAAKSKSRK